MRKLADAERKHDDPLHQEVSSALALAMLKSDMEGYDFDELYRSRDWGRS